MSPGLLTPKVNINKPFQFKKGRHSTVSRSKKIEAPEIIRVEESPVAIPAEVGSTLEAIGYRAMLAAGWRPDQIEIQTPVLGGRNPRGGGQVVDFVLFKPFPVPIRFNGDWWHQNKDEDLEKNIKLSEYYNTPAVIIWGHECSRDGGNVYDFEQTLAVVIRKIGRA